MMGQLNLLRPVPPQVDQLGSQKILEMQNSNGGYEEDPGNYDAEEDYHEEMMEVRFKLINCPHTLCLTLTPLAGAAGYHHGPRTRAGGGAV